MFVLLEQNSGTNYFVEPSFEGWKLTKDIEKATVFNSQETAEKMKETINRASVTTYWDWNDIQPWAVVKSY